MTTQIISNNKKQQQIVVSRVPEVQNPNERDRYGCGKSCRI